MSDVDSIRWMASEHDLEFVDLDTYGVDPAAGEILPESLARQYHVVAIKRKFGTPVIATADPDDVFAQETVRAAIGRDFISVVASRDQIGAYLDQLFGSTVTPPEQEKPVLSLVEDPLDTVPGDDSSQTDADSAEGAEVTAPEPRASPAPGKKRHRKDESTPKPPKAQLLAEVVAPPEGEHPPLTESERSPDDALPTASPDIGQLVVRPVGEATSDVPGAELPPMGDTTGSDPVAIVPGDDRLDPDSAPVPVEADAVIAVSPSGPPSESPSDSWPRRDEGIEMSAVGAEAAQLVDEPTTDLPGATTGGLEPATNLLPTFGTGLAPPDPSTPDVPTSSVPPEPATDQLAELALSVRDEEDPPNPDSAVMAADLVAEAVATYQEQHGPDDRPDGSDPDSPTGTSMFPPLAKALVDGERVSLEAMEEVLDEHYRTGQSVARILTAQKLVTEADLMWGMAQEMGLEFVDLDVAGINYADAGTIPEATARHHNVMVIGNDNGVPVVAASNPTDVFAMDDLRTIMGRSFIVVVATRTQISSYIGKAFNSGGDAADMAMEASLGFDGSGHDESVDDIQAVTEEAPIVRYVNLLILQALNERASDIHVEPTETDLRIRYRIDGVLHDISTAPRSIAAAVTTRLKVMADMNVAEHRIPQDGRISLNVGSKGIDLRMATLPVIHGEKVVMRVLDKSSVVLGFADLGFDEELLAKYEAIYTKPNGTILVTGPTGSGKSTTLYTTLTALNTPEKNIITVEDPVELQLRGVNQVQLNVKAGLTFASALKSILRSDPDIVLVGEIRDKETAVIAIEAALTGHMVLSTLHTNGAASTPMRLIEMGLEPFLVTSALSGVLAQRLARRLCVHCKEAYEPTEADIAAAGWTVEEVEAVGDMSKVFRAVGCSACSNTGYRGRKALSEFMPMTEEIERLIIEGGSVEDIHRLAVAQGMLTLRQSGIRKAIEGETTLEEVLRVVA